MAYEVDKPKKNWVTYNGEIIAPKISNTVIMPVTEAEAKQITADRKAWKDSTDERTLEQIRNKRDGFLNQTDWKVIQALEQGKELSEKFKTWRQNLRDVPQDYKASDYEKLKELKHSVWQEPKE